MDKHTSESADAIAQRYVQIERLFSEIASQAVDLVSASLGRDEPDLETIVIVMATVSGDADNQHVTSALDCLSEGWRLPTCRALSAGAKACIEEVARRLETDETSAECALRDYCDQLDDDETVPSTGFGVWVRDCMLEIDGVAE